MFELKIRYTRVELEDKGPTTPGLIVTVYAIVEPCELGHIVGITYTFDEWVTVKEAEGKWLRNELSYELWAFRIQIDGNYPLDAQMWFSVYVRRNFLFSPKVWDNNNGWNYQIQLQCPSEQRVFLERESSN